MSTLKRIEAFQASDRCELDTKAVRWCVTNSIEFVTLTGAITAYLAKLDPRNDEWDRWLDAYGEAKLLAYFGVEI